MDTLTQCFANSLVLAIPILLSASNPLAVLHPFELAGVALWAISWLLENAADGQKIMFLQDCKSLGQKKAARDEKDSIRLAVLGYPPFDSSRYWLWTKCRHPNYFFEWTSWIAFALVGLGSVTTKDQWLSGGEGNYMSLLLVTTLILMVRFFYDCLLYWTGSAPSEQQSVRKRPLYAAYQRSTRIFFPFFVPEWIVNHHRTPGWPLSDYQQPGPGNSIDNLDPPISKCSQGHLVSYSGYIGAVQGQ